MKNQHQVEPSSGGHTEQTKKRGMSSFCVPVEGLTRLYAAGCTKREVCAYLVISAHTDADGTQSTAGLGVIRRRLGCREEVAERLVGRLVDVGVLKDLRQPKGERTFARNEVHFWVHDFDEPIDARIWFSRTLTDVDPTIEDEYSPISDLYGMADECIYTLIWLYALQSERWNGVQPPQPKMNSSGAFVRYTFDKDGERDKLSHLLQVVRSGDLEIEGCPLFQKYGHEAIYRAFNILLNSGFIYEVIMVYSDVLESASDHPHATYLTDDAEHLYQFHGRSRGRKLPDDELGVSQLTLKVAKFEDLEVFLPDGKLEKFVLMSRPGTRCGVAGIFRLRHRVRNPLNRGVARPWAELMDSERRYRKWLINLLRSEYKVEVETFRQHTAFQDKRLAIQKRPENARPLGAPPATR